jgi:hypothetical protein
LVQEGLEAVITTQGQLEVIPFLAASRHPAVAAGPLSSARLHLAAAAVAAETDIHLTTTMRLEHPATRDRSRQWRATRAEMHRMAVAAVVVRVP